MPAFTNALSIFAKVTQKQVESQYYFIKSLYFLSLMVKKREKHSQNDARSAKSHYF